MANMGFIPQLDLAKQLNFTQNCFSFRVNNSSPNAIPVRLFGSIADLTRISTNSVSATTENINVASAYNDVQIAASKYAISEAVIGEYAILTNNKMLDLVAADDVTVSTGDLTVETNDMVTFYQNNPQKFPVSVELLRAGLADVNVTVKNPVTVETKSVATAITVGSTPAQQTGANPFIIDGNFAANLTATSLVNNKKIADLWSYVIGNNLTLRAIMIVADDVNALQSNITVNYLNPFFDMPNNIIALSKYQNPYIVNQYCGLVHGLNVAVHKNRYFGLNIFPNNTDIHLFFE